MIPVRPNRRPADLWMFRPDLAEINDPIRRYSIYTIHEADDTLWHGLDTLAALRLPTSTIDPDASTWQIGWETEEGLVPWLPTAYVRALAADRGDFLDFLDKTLEAYRFDRRHHTSTPTPAPAPLVDARKDTFSVVAAAQLLSRDPVLQYGRETLLEKLRELGWVTRAPDGSFAPAPAHITAGWLQRNDACTPNTRTAYNRVRITREGLHELHQRLGGIADLHIDSPAIPALI